MTILVLHEESSRPDLVLKSFFCTPSVLFQVAAELFARIGVPARQRGTVSSQYLQGLLPPAHDPRRRGSKSVLLTIIYIVSESILEHQSYN